MRSPKVTHGDGCDACRGRAGGRVALVYVHENACEARRVDHEHYGHGDGVRHEHADGYGPSHHGSAHVHDAPSNATTRPPPLVLLRSGIVAKRDRPVR